MKHYNGRQISRINDNALLKVPSPIMRNRIKIALRMLLFVSQWEKSLKPIERKVAQEEVKIVNDDIHYQALNPRTSQNTKYTFMRAPIKLNTVTLSILSPTKDKTTFPTRNKLSKPLWKKTHPKINQNKKKKGKFKPCGKGINVVEYPPSETMGSDDKENIRLNLPSERLLRTYSTTPDNTLKGNDDSFDVKLKQLEQSTLTSEARLNKIIEKLKLAL